MYDILVIGTTFYGLGVAQQNAKNTLVIDRGTKLGYEFINTFNPGDGCEKEKGLSAVAAMFLKKMKNKRIFHENGLYHLPALEPMLCAWADHFGITPYFMTDIVSITPKGDGFAVVLNTVSGLKTVMAAKILDTTGNNLKIKSKAINSLLMIPKNFSISLEPWINGCRFIYGALSRQVALSLTISPDDDWVAARRKLHVFWDSRPKKYAPVTLAMVADFFDIETFFPKKSNGNYIQIASKSFGNPLAALDAGIKWSF
ncbi:MAG: hypothetical protein M0R40_03960 [Firmicutes bacterium]|nr:hypothetical protein [Bacillota bacterium]